MLNTVFFFIISMFQSLLNFGNITPTFIVDELRLRKVINLIQYHRSTKEPGSV